MLRFLQLSDVHFGAPLRGGRLELGSEAARQRTQERRDLFARAVALVEERDLDGVLLPGDLFDDESITRDTLRFVQHCLGSIAPKPVFLAPGNHDPFGGSSPYNPQVGAEAWPANVHLFAHEDFRSVSWPGRDDVRVVGCGVRADVPSDERRLAQFIEREQADTSILLFHGSRDDGGWLQASKSTYPFSRDELLAQDFTWTALGHYHGQQTVTDDSGRPRAAYAGSPHAGGLDEQGVRGVLIVSVDRDRTEVEFVRVDHRQVRDVRCDLTGCEFAEQAADRAREALTAAGAADSDLILLRLVGRRMPGLPLEAVHRLASDYFHMRVDASKLAADVELDRYPSLEQARTVEERFVAKLREAVAGGDARARVALQYGLDALQRGALDTRYED